MTIVHYGFKKRNLDSKKGDELFQKILTKFIVWAEVKIAMSDIDSGFRRPSRSEVSSKINFGGLFEWNTGVFKLVIQRDRFVVEESSEVSNESMIIFFKAEPGILMKDQEKQKRLKEKCQEFSSILDEFLVKEGIAIPLRYYYER